jgi:hypothetical protein
MVFNADERRPDGPAWPHGRRQLGGRPRFEHEGQEVSCLGDHFVPRAVRFPARSSFCPDRGQKGDRRHFPGARAPKCPVPHPFSAHTAQITSPSGGRGRPRGRAPQRGASRRCSTPTNADGVQRLATDRTGPPGPGKFGSRALTQAAAYEPNSLGNPARDRTSRVRRRAGFRTDAAVGCWAARHPASPGGPAPTTFIQPPWAAGPLGIQPRQAAQHPLRSSSRAQRGPL